MSAFGRGTLAAALATAMTVAPSVFAQENRVAGKPESAGAASIVLDGDVKLSTTAKAGIYSEQHEAVGIAVAKGKKNEAGLTGEDIGEILSQALKEKYQVPSKYFVRESSGDYSNIIFFVKGIPYGPYSPGKSVEALAPISMKFDQAHGLPFQRKAADVAGKLEPTQD
jgi:hypothetical protein